VFRRARLGCRDAAKIDKTRLSTLTSSRRVAKACQSSVHKTLSREIPLPGPPIRGARTDRSGNGSLWGECGREVDCWRRHGYRVSGAATGASAVSRLVGPLKSRPASDDGGAYGVSRCPRLLHGGRSA
jgi:hypothetical protein